MWAIACCQKAPWSPALLIYSYCIPPRSSAPHFPSGATMFFGNCRSGKEMYSSKTGTAQVCHNAPCLMELRGHCVSKVNLIWSGITVWNTALGTAVSVWLIYSNVTRNNLQICTNPHSLFDLSARPCLSNTFLLMALSFSNKNSPKLVRGTTVFPFSKQPDVWLFLSVHSKTLHGWGASSWEMDRTHFFLKLWF